MNAVGVILSFVSAFFLAQVPGLCIAAICWISAVLYFSQRMDGEIDEEIERKMDDEGWIKEWEKRRVKRSR